MTFSSFSVGGVPSPWIGDRLTESVVDVLSFDGQNYPIRMDATAEALVWTVPDHVASLRGTKASFESSLDRVTVAGSVEAWRFPKLEQEPLHEVVVLLDREQGTAISLELVLRSAPTRLRPAIRVLRGTIAGYPSAYGGFAFPRFRPTARRVSFVADGIVSFIDFDRAGQPSAVGRGDGRVRASGHVVTVSPDAWAVIWHSSNAVGLVLFDERASVVNGQTLEADTRAATTFGVRSDIVTD
jgi:hypothetical protein